MACFCITAGITATASKIFDGFMALWLDSAVALRRCGAVTNHTTQPNVHNRICAGGLERASSPVKPLVLPRTGAAT